ncbi:YidB family protein [Streptomyces sp. NPDC050418]|uniref:YidB family protein n=1 Tax=Streptomyces sp. NPDC050418 TaxID=3365612 RepID=UPI003793BBEF
MAGNSGGPDLGSLLGSLLGGGGQGGSGGGGNILTQLLQSFLGGSGGGGGGQGGGNNPLSGLLEGLNKAGLTEQTDSWVGKGDNQPVTGAQVQEALPTDALHQVAEKNGISEEQAANEIAAQLPQAVDKLTPQGQVPTSLEEMLKQQNL